MGDEDPDTGELRAAQARREAVERERSWASGDPDETLEHERRADKAGYLRQKLAERERAEREAGDPPESA